jgi:hypothetical protein
MSSGGNSRHAASSLSFTILKFGHQQPSIPEGVKFSDCPIVAVENFHAHHGLGGYAIRDSDLHAAGTGDFVIDKFDHLAILLSMSSFNMAIFRITLFSLPLRQAVLYSLQQA